MRNNYAKLALATVLSAMVVAPLAGAYAQAQGTSEVRIDIDLRDMDMLTATKSLFQRTGIQFVIEPGMDEFKRVTLKLTNVTPEEAVRYICQAAGASFHKDEAGVYIIGHSKPTPMEAAPISVATPKAPHIFRKIKVLKAGAQEIFDMVMHGTAFNGLGSLDTLRRLTSSMRSDDYGRVYGPQFNVLNNVPANQTYQPSPASVQPTAATGTESNRQVAIPGSEASNQGFGGGRQGGGGGGLQGGGGGGGLGQGNGGGGLGQGGGGNVQLQGGQGLVGGSIDFISYDPNDNSIVVRGDEEDINQLQGYISQFDVAPRQVQIKVEFITTTDSLTKSLGYDFLYSRGIIATGTRPGSMANTSDPVFLNYSTGNIATRLRASMSRGGGTVVTSPIIRTLNNQPAFLSTNVTQYIFVDQTTVSNGTVLHNTQPVPIQITTQLVVAPRINEDNTITMGINPQLANITGLATDPNGSQIPIVTTQTIGVIARVRNGDTIVLGGLNSKNETTSSIMVPVLSELPIIGQFFRTMKKDRNNSELLVFVTPTIIEEDVAGGE